MADEEFQVFITQEDYDRFSKHQQQNQQLLKQRQQLTQQIAALQDSNRDLKKRLHVRDSFIEHLIGECQCLLGTILQVDIVGSDLGKSFYQDIVSHEQNGLSSIELRSALDLYLEQHQELFGQMKGVADKFQQQDQRLKGLERELKRRKRQTQEAEERSSKLINSADTNKLFEVEQIRKRIIQAEQEIQELQQEKKRLKSDTEALASKNEQLRRENRDFNSKGPQGEKTYLLKLMLDEYYSELEKNLAQLGGLSDKEMKTVIANQMKGITHYIDTLIRKAEKRF